MKDINRKMTTVQIQKLQRLSLSTSGRSLPFVLAVLISGISTLQSCMQSLNGLSVSSRRAPELMNDGIAVGHLSEVKMDSGKISELTKQITIGNFSNLHSLLIMKDGKLVYEQYFAGRDQKHGKKLGYIDHSAQQLHDCRSISKSIVSACIGIAVKNKIIESVEDPVGKYFPEIKDSTKGAITIKNLLTMTAGLEWKEMGSYGSFFNSETQMDLRFDPIRYILKKKLVTKPGGKWNYSAGNTQLLAEIIHRRTGLPVDSFAAEYLFRPLGIHAYEWINLTLKKIPAAASGLRLRSRDMLKFGMLYMNKGNFNGMQILDSSWVRSSLRSYIERPDLKQYKIKPGGYGYQFWIYHDSVKGQGVDIIEAKGNGGQSVFICPSVKLLVITTGGNYNRSHDDAYRMLEEYILPSLLDAD